MVVDSYVRRSFEQFFWLIMKALVKRSEVRNQIKCVIFKMRFFLINIIEIKKKLYT